MLKRFLGIFLLFIFSLGGIYLYFYLNNNITYIYYYSDSCSKCKEISKDWNKFKHENTYRLAGIEKIEEKNIKDDNNKAELQQIMQEKNVNPAQGKSVTIPSLIVKKNNNIELYSGTANIINYIKKETR